MIGPDLTGKPLTGREREVLAAIAQGWPIRVALDTWRPTGTDPRGSWRWCHVCIGHLVAMAGIETSVLSDCLTADDRGHR